MTTLPLYTISIIPPAAVFPYVRVIADRLALISPYILVTDEPHLSLTGVLSGEEKVAALVNELKERLIDHSPFDLSVGPPIRMSEGKFPENFALSIPALPELVALSDVVGDITLKHFPELRRSGLFSFKDHIYLVQNIPEELRLAVAKEAHKLWKPLSFTVDRIWIVRRHAGKLTREPIYFKDRAKAEYVEAFIPDDDAARWMLAVMFARLQPVDDKFGLQKSLFLVDHEQVRQHRYDFVPYLHGPYSTSVETLSQKLESAGLLKFDGYMHSLTPLGEKVAGLCYSYREHYERQWISASMKKHAGRSGPELVEYVHITYPEWHMLEKNYPDS